MPYNIIIGRDDADLEKFGDKGSIFIGKQWIKMGQTSSLSNNILLDVNRPHVILVDGKRGSGKSYSLSVIAEEMSLLPKEIANNLSCLMFDTMGVFWTMKFPNERDESLLKKWNLKPQGMNINIFVPIGRFEEYKERGIPVDFSFSIKPNELNSEDWANVFEININDQVGILIERILERLKGKEFSIEDIIRFIREDVRAEKQVKDAAENRFLAANGWGIFSEDGTEIRELIKPGKTSIIDTSAYTSENIKALVIGLICRKLLNERIAIRKQEEIDVINNEYKEKEMPLVWVMVDECLEGNSEIITDKAHTPIKNIVKRFKEGEKFKVMGYDKKTGGYDYYDVTGVFNKGKKQIIKLTTETGKELRCTPEHRVLARSGFFSAFSVNEIATPLIQHYSKNEKIITARLVGHLFGDGWASLNEETLGFSGKGNNLDLLKIKEDLKILGFSSSNIYSRKTISEITDFKGKKAIVRGISHSIKASSKSFRYFLKFGIPVGDKAIKESSIPNWILNSSDAEKAEFLAALMGSDGQVISRVKKKKAEFNAIRFSFNKLENLEDNAFEFANQIKTLFEGLGIKVSRILKRRGNIRKDGTKTIKMVITIANNIENTIRFLEKIGYRYCEKKEMEGNKWLSYLKARLSIKKQRDRLRERAIELHKKGLGKIKISRELKIPDFHVREWIYFNRKAGVPKSFLDFDTWIKERVDRGIIYEKIVDISDVGYEEVFDISVDKVHNFVSNGLITHNCHAFLPKEGKTAATDALIQLLREGRQPGISLVLATQQPGEIHKDVMTQSDIIISHRVTANPDIDALNNMMQTYLITDLQKALNQLPKLKGAAIILDDNSERLYNIMVKPKLSWHGGESTTAIKIKKELVI